MNAELKKWLVSRSSSPFVVSEDNTYVTILVAVPKSESFSYLFCQRFCDAKSPLETVDLKFGGIYCVKDGNIYCAADDLLYSMNRNEDLMSRTKKKLQEQLTQKVREKVNAKIGNDRSKLKVTEITNPMLLRDLDNMNQYSAKTAARQHFLEGNVLDSISFSCAYSFGGWTKNNVLRYILDPDGFAQEEADAYEAEHQEDMLFEFLRNDALIKEYTALTSDPTNPVFVIREIMTAVKKSNAKTVNVTILKNGRQFAFKTDASDFKRDCQTSYADYNVAAADRRLLRATFGGGSVSYTPQEIVSITYGRKVLYESNGVVA